MQVQDSIDDPIQSAGRATAVVQSGFYQPGHHLVAPWLRDCGDAFGGFVFPAMGAQRIHNNLCQGGVHKLRTYRFVFFLPGRGSCRGYKPMLAVPSHDVTAN